MFVSAGYIVVAVAIGAVLQAVGAPGSTLCWPSLVATALVAVAFQPVRKQVLRLVDRLVYGNRAAPYEALATLGRRLADRSGRPVGRTSIGIRRGQAICGPPVVPQYPPVALFPVRHRKRNAPAHRPGMPATQPSRVPAGVPTGGRFAATRHTDPGTDLLERTDPGAERELFDRFSASARHWGNRLGVDAEDLLQDTAVEFYATLARQRGANEPQPGLNGRTVKPSSSPATPMANPGGWIHRIAYNIAARRVAGTNSSADLAALREYRTRLQDAESRCGHELSAAEADRLADEIRLGRPPRRRPTSGFHRRVRQVSTEALGPDWDAPAESNPLDGNEFRAHTPGAVAEELLSRSGSPGRAAARRLAWDAVADVTGAPVVVPEVIDPGTARDAARLVDDAGGATAVSRRWVIDPRNPAVTALFTPFGRLDTHEQQSVIRTIHRSGGYGDKVWAAALQAATVRRDRRAG